jgi:regulation of enolase protein 1 (concanavalin A-like superfamily)
MRDLNQVKCIKDEANRLLVKDEEIKNIWRKYFNGLFSDSNGTNMTELDDSFDAPIDVSCGGSKSLRLRMP